jgi:hypothetical protein
MSVNFRVVARIERAGGPYQSIAEDQLLIEYDLPTGERVLAVASILYDPYAIVRLERATKTDSAPWPLCADVLDLWRSPRFFALPVITYDEAEQQAYDRADGEKDEVSP